MTILEEQHAMMMLVVILLIIVVVLGLYAIYLIVDHRSAHQYLQDRLSKLFPDKHGKL